MDFNFNFMVLEDRDMHKKKATMLGKRLGQFRSIEGLWSYI